ncbi:proton channel OtopLc-like [Macrobrachium rosenbergii]|uniref:proton channel OtopLc-like n=1 Tax=Macrobrachium rosenbergii TaxID=79674 RepID=UPI0034D6ED95
MDNVTFYIEEEASSDESVRDFDAEACDSAFESALSALARSRKTSAMLNTNTNPSITRVGGSEIIKIPPSPSIQSSQSTAGRLSDMNNMSNRSTELILNVSSPCFPLEQDDSTSQRKFKYPTENGVSLSEMCTIGGQWILKKQDPASYWERISSTNNVRENAEETHAIVTMTKKEKRQWFNKTLSSNLSLIYSILLVTLGGIIYVWDVLESHAVPIAEWFNIYLMVVQLLFLMYIHLDCRRYTTLIAKKLKQAEKEKELLESKYSDSQESPGIEGSPPAKVGYQDIEEIPQYYGFTSGRHGGSLYVKIGAAVFCFGYMIQAGLGLGQKILYFINQKPGSEPCTSETDIAMGALKLIYVFYKLFFIFKFSNVIINHRLYISHFGLMHCIGASLCFWVYNILQETFQSLSIKDPSDSGKNSSHLVTAAYTFVYGDTKEKTWNFHFTCDDHNQLSDTINHLTPYLFPFSIEYNILMVGFWILMLENLSRMDRHTHIPSIEVSYEDDTTNSKSLISNFLIYVDCHASMRGLFAGLIVTVFATISIILFYVLSAAEHTAVIAVELTAYVEMIIFLLMLASSIIVFYHLQELDIMTHSSSNADDILLFSCLPLIFLYAMACAIPYIGDEHIVTWFFNVTQIVQAIVQTALICDGLRRCSNSPSVRNKKPGREFIMFLVVSNLAMWLMQTFQIKSKHGNSTAYDFYGEEIWTLVSHFTLPFVLFYRFHSSACLAVMWMEAYMTEPTT